jgi:acetyl-CoA carboxylase biotin carboxylase subunit
LPHGSGVRDDGGIYEGSEISIYYDPMISKFAVHGKDRAEAIDRMRRALQEYEVGGIKTTLGFFREVVEDEEFIEGRLDTGFIPRFKERQKAKQREISETERDMAIIAAALVNSSQTKTVAAEKQPAGNKPSRWALTGRSAAFSNRF